MDLLAVLVALNVLLLTIFRLFKTYEIHTFQAIVFNYITCMTVGSLVLGEFPISSETVNEKWFPYAIVLGIMFITGFNILGRTVQLFGVTLTSIAQKMSLVITVCFTIFFFSESINTLKILGILAAVTSIIMINIPKKGLDLDDTKMKKLWYMLFLTFFISGLIETLLFYIEAMDISQSADIGFVVTLFGIAAAIGSPIVIGGVAMGKMKFQWKNVIAGILLGIPNFFTIYLMLKMIDNGWEGSDLFPILNVSIILGAAIIGLLIFREKLSKLQWIGFICGILCIILIALSQ